MCGRYAIIDGKRVLASYPMLQQAHGTDRAFEGTPRYNASPMQRLPVFAVRGEELQAEAMQWWLVPHWSKDGKPSVSSFNARAETLDESRLFKPYFKGSRCLVPADAFYEWKALDAGATGKKQPKQPFCIRLRSREPFMFAGLFSVWKNAEGKERPSFTIITSEPNERVKPLHHRMAVILPERHFAQWLDRSFTDTAALKQLLAPYPAKEMEVYPVSTALNNSRTEGPACMEPVEF